MSDRCVAGDKLRTVMSSIMRRRKGLIVAIWKPPVWGVGCNTHILSGRRPFTRPRRSRRDSGFVQSSFADQSQKSAKVVLASPPLPHGLWSRVLPDERGRLLAALLIVD